jgi:non-heme chloroperoxidase
MNRRQMLTSLSSIAIGGPLRGQSRDRARPASKGVAADKRSERPTFIDAKDGTRLFLRDWGNGRTILFVSPWALTCDWFEYQMTYLTSQGLRCVGYDRRGHGRSDEPGRGYDFDTLADDFATVIDRLGLRDLTLVGHSMGAGEVVRYLSRYRARGVRRVALIAPITPFTLKAPDNPDGVDKADLEKGRTELSRDRPGRIALAAPAFFGTGQNAVSAAMIEWWTDMIIEQCSLKVMLDLHRVFTETDFRPDLRTIAVPTLIIHGDSDTSTPLEFTGRKTASLIRGSQLKVYKGAAHALPITHMDLLNRDLLSFVTG